MPEIPKFILIYTIIYAYNSNLNLNNYFTDFNLGNYVTNGSN